MKKSFVQVAMVILFTLSVTACSSTGNVYDGAFSSAQAPAGAPETVQGDESSVLKSVKWVLVKQGFVIQKNDPVAGTVVAERDYVDPSETDKSYLIDVNVAVQESNAKGSSMVAMSATQNTILHTKEHTWWHLLWILPIIPTGTVYETVATGEGTVGDKAFYSHFYDQLRQQLRSKS